MTMTSSSGKNSGKQRKMPAGRRFQKGQSGNPKGRPRTKGLLRALRAAMATVQDGRTVEERLVAGLVGEALRGRSKLAAIREIFDRLEGKPTQQLDLNDVTRQMRERTDEELRHFAEHGKWPNEEGAADV